MERSILQDWDGAFPVHAGYLLRWLWRWDPPVSSPEELRQGFNELLRWNYSCSHKKPLDLVDFRMIMLPYEEWVLDDGTVIMLGRDAEPWFRRLPNGTVECFDPEKWVAVYGGYADMGEPGYAWVRPQEERLYYDENSQDEAAMTKAAEDALRAWGMPVPIFEKFTAWAEAIEADES